MVQVQSEVTIQRARRKETNITVDYSLSLSSSRVEDKSKV